MPDETFAEWVARTNRLVGDHAADALPVDLDAVRTAVHVLARTISPQPGQAAAGADITHRVADVAVYTLRLCRELQALRVQVAAQGDMVSLAEVCAALRTHAFEDINARTAVGYQRAAGFLERWAGGRRRPSAETP